MSKNINGNSEKSPSIPIKDKEKKKGELNNGKMYSKEKRIGGIMDSVLEYKSISTAKQQFPSIFKQALKGYEIIAANNKSKEENTVSILSTEDYIYMLNTGFKFHPVIEKDEEDNGYTVTIDEVMVFGDGDTIEAAYDDLIDNLIEYTEIYFSKLDFYKQIPNRRNHYPYLRRIASCTDRNKILEVLTECLKDSTSETLRKSQSD